MLHLQLLLPGQRLHVRRRRRLRRPRPWPPHAGHSQQTDCGRQQGRRSGEALQGDLSNIQVATLVFNTYLKMSPLGASLEVHKRRLLLEEGGGRQEGGVDRDLRAELGDNLHLGELPLKWLLVYLQTSMAQSSAWRQWYAVSNDKLTQKPS